MEVRVVEFSEYFPRFYLSCGDLFFDVVDNHQEVFALLGVGGVVVRPCDDCAVVLHDDCWELERDG